MKFSKNSMKHKFKTLAIIICRTGSKRLNNKIFLKINNKTILKIIYEKLSICKNIDNSLAANRFSKITDGLYSFRRFK